MCFKTMDTRCERIALNVNRESIEEKSREESEKGAGRPLIHMWSEREVEEQQQKQSSLSLPRFI